MESKCIKSSLIKEEYFYMKHPTGLSIYIHPKRGYSSKYAIIGTDFGSINSKFKLKNQKSFTVVPDGIAHYLEHKLFETKKGDAFDLFAKTGASANAYTSFEKTAYLFSCTDKFEESLSILLDFVQSPYFTQKSVDKERGIIGQEIKMYEDDPDWKVLINLIGALYKNHPVRKDVAGTVESIAKITPEMLYECYNTFYNLHNMSLCIVGDIDPDKIFTLVDEKLKYSEPLEVERFFPEETWEINQKNVSESFDMQFSIFSLGFKENVPVNSRRTVSDLVYTDIILKCLGSRTSDMYRELLEEELINTSSFSHEYFEGPGYASEIFSGESRNPEKAAEIIRKYTNKIHATGIDEKTFEREKKAAYGQNISAFNSVSTIANLLLDFSLSGNEVFEYMNVLAEASAEKANDKLNSILSNEHSALSVAKPRQ